jgi:predicted phage terminase large subunit-like protein
MDIFKQEAYRVWRKTLDALQNDKPPLKEESKTVQKARIERARKDYAYFVKTYFSDIATTPCGRFQIDEANYLLKNPNARQAAVWARGHAKSTHFGVFIPLWLKIQQQRTINTVILISRNEDTATRLLRDLQQQLQYNDLYIHDYGTQVKQGSWAAGEFTTMDDCFFTCFGRGQSPRGIKNMGKRPDYILIDDIDDEELCRNEKRVREAAEWCLTDVLGTMAMGRGRFIIVGNLIAKSSILAEICKRPNIHTTQVNALDRQGQPTWKENYILQEIKALRETMGERNFQQEYMNNPITEGAVFSQKHIHYGKILPLKEYRQLICYTDPSFKNSATADYKATVLAGRTPDGYFHIIKVFADQTSVSNMIAWHYDIMKYVNGRVPVMYFMESNFMQDLMLDEFKQVGNILGNHVPIRGDNRKKPDKFARIEALQPLFERGLIIFNEDERNSAGMTVLVEQLLLFERGSRSHDDAPDALESAIWMLSQRTRATNAKYVIGARPTRKF